jgi:hypothetical protein
MWVINISIDNKPFLYTNNNIITSMIRKIPIRRMAIEVQEILIRERKVRIVNNRIKTRKWPSRWNGCIMKVLNDV